MCHSLQFNRLIGNVMLGVASLEIGEDAARKFAGNSEVDCVFSREV